nr:N-6 DNA methylase [Endozoicomonas montiporae]
MRRYILESDLLEAIVALPTDMFYNTGIATYVWVLTNKKSDERKGKVQLINGVNLCGKMRKSLGSKRNIMSKEDRAMITRCFGEFTATATDYPEGHKGGSAGNAGAIASEASEDNFASKIFDSHEFGYRRITVERPLRLSVDITIEALRSLKFAPKPYNNVMRWMYHEFRTNFDAIFDQGYEDSSPAKLDALWQDNEEVIRSKIKKEFKELKEKQIKEVLSHKIWIFHHFLAVKGAMIAGNLEQLQWNDFNEFDATLKDLLKGFGMKLDAKERKQFLDAVTLKNPEAEPVIKKILKEEAQPLYGAFEYSGSVKEYQGKVVEFQTDGDLRDNENIPLDPSVTTRELIETCFNREVAPHVPDAWINADKCDARDGEMGIVGYEIPFNRHFYVYQPPRALEAIDADLDAVSARIMNLLKEVHS